MTSSRLFFRALREDLKHKIWMLALSTVASFLFVLVAYLLINRMGYRVWIAPSKYYEAVERFFVTILATTAGIVAVVGAAIVGFFSFRHLFHRNMADTYHSLPIKRSTMFWVTYLNGFLIWFVPLLVTLLIVLPIALCGNAGVLFEKGYFLSVIATIGTTLLYLVVVFFLIYNTILVAVMLSGNILNTIVCTAIFGMGGIVAYYLCAGFLAIYRESFWTVSGEDFFIYISPLISACNLLVNRIGLAETGTDTMLLLNGIIALLLLAIAYFLHQRRASELAEQGIKNRGAAYLLKVVASVTAGMGGWIVFSLLTLVGLNDYSIGWGIFGAVFCSVLVYGVIDIIVHMDFKAFFASKWVMLGCTAFTIFLCMAFQFDWIGYDHYLPEKSKIESIGIRTYYSNKFGNSLCEDVASTNQELIYEVLQRGVANVGKKADMAWSEMMSLPVCVRMKNGRTYYREYTMTRDEEQLIMKLLKEPEYVEEQYVLDSELTDEKYDWTLNGIETRTDIKREEVRKAFLTAYNQDVRENPGLMVGAQDHVLAKLYISGNNLFVTDKMMRTLEVLKKNGYEEILNRPAVEDIQEITLDMNCLFWDVSQNNVETRGMDITEHYKVYNVDSAMYEMKITDRQEIEELIDILHFNLDQRNRPIFDAYQEDGAWILKEDGEYLDATFYYDELPEKYIERYKNLMK